MLEVKTVPLEDLHADPSNARKHGQRNLEAIRGSLRQFGQVEPLVVQKSTGKVIGGNGRLEVMRSEGAATAEVVEVDIDDTKAAALGIALNRSAELAEWDLDALGSITDALGDTDIDLDGLGFDASELEEVLENGPEEQFYTAKVESPIYEPKGEKPLVSDLFDTTKTDSLLDNIEAADIPDDVRIFLRHAAARHTKFDYQSVAEFYCHASPETQRLIEESALVIIDFNQAIENGFVQFNKGMADAYTENYEAQNG